MKSFIRAIILFFPLSLLFWSCDYGQLGGADQTETCYPGDDVFEERMSFLCGVWYSHYAGIGRLDGYRIRKWSDFKSNDDDMKKTQDFFHDINVVDLITYKTKDSPANSDYILIYDDTVYGEQDDGNGGNGGWKFKFMGLIRAINIFNNDINRGSIIIEYFEGTDNQSLSEQGLTRGEKPFYGIYFRVLSPDIVQMANAVDWAALYAGKPYYTEKGTLDEAVEANGVENEAEFINWGMTIPQDREK